jgi:tetratricopeptide (TPR) repeat protein
MNKLGFKSLSIIAGIFCILTGIQVKAQTLADAITLSKNEQYDKAESLFQQLIKAEPANSKLYFYYGEDILLNFFSDTISNSLPVAMKEAGDLFNKGVTANGTDPLNYVGLARVAFYLEDNAKAQQMRDKAKSLLPPYKKVTKIENPKEYAFTLGKLAESFIRFDQVDTTKAMPFIREALLIDPKNSEVYIIAGDIYLLINNGSNSIRNYNLAQNYDPTSPTANMKIGNIYARGRNLMAAIPYYEQAMALNKDYSPAYREMGQLYSMAGRFNDAKKYFATYLELTKGNIPAKIRYVNALFYAKEYKEVISNVEEIFKVDDSRPYLNRIAGYSAYEQGNYPLSVSFLEKLFATLQPELLIKKDYIYFARALVKKNQTYPKLVIETDNEIANLAKLQDKMAAAKGPDVAKIKGEMDALTEKVKSDKEQLELQEKELNKGFESYEKAINFAAEDIALINEKARSQYENKRYKMAADTWSRLLDKGKNSENDFLQIGRTYILAKDYDMAEQTFAKMIAKYPDNLQGYFYDANVASYKDPDSKLGLAKPKFIKVLEIGSKDSVKNAQEMFDALRALGYNAMQAEKYDEAGDYYNRMLNLAPNNSDFKLKALGSMSAMYLQTGEVGKATDVNNKILALDPENESAKSNLRYISDRQKNALPKVSANEITGVISDTNGQPIASASVRVKDTAAEAWTNAKGEYKFVMPEASQTLVISAKGYRTILIPVTKKRIYNASLSK